MLGDYSSTDSFVLTNFLGKEMKEQCSRCAISIGLPVSAAAHQLVGAAVQIHAVEAEAVAEEVAGDVAELDADLGAPVRQGLAGLEEEGHAVPARIVDEQRDRSKGGAQAAGTGRRALSCLECVHANLWCRPTPCETSAKGQPYTSADG